MSVNYDVLIIGAGPAGSVAAAMLADRGHSVCVVEQAQFPRFSIGESLLPQAMAFLDQADLLDPVHAGGFQLKTGAVFRHGPREQAIDFSDKSVPGWATTYQVERARFDRILADGAARKGAEIRFGTTVLSVTPGSDETGLRVRDELGDESELSARFLLDASGFGRVLARLLDLERPSALGGRQSLFTHVRDNIPANAFDRNKILISIHPAERSIWYWLIPLAGGVSSIGVVGRAADIQAAGASDGERLRSLVDASGHMADLLRAAEPVRPVGSISGYACSVTSLCGPGYALLGNAAEFLDPVFSSGVTIAMKSAVLAADAVHRQLEGEPVDWQQTFTNPLYDGIETFRAFVEAWYEGSLQDIIFKHAAADSDLRGMIVSVLAGYAWDRSNPFVREPKRLLSLVAEL